MTVQSGLEMQRLWYIHPHNPTIATGSTQQHWPYPPGDEESGYAYILTHPGMPCVLWEHYFDNGFGDAIKALIGIR